jgi:predicted transcriptional regulator
MREDNALDTATLTVRVPKAYRDRLRALAQTTRRSHSDLASEARATYLSVQEWQVAAIYQAVEAADSGATSIEHAAVAAWLRSWGGADEQPPPR